MTPRNAWGLGLATIVEDGTVLDVWYPAPQLGDRPEPSAWERSDLHVDLNSLRREDDARGVYTEVFCIRIDLDTPPTSTADAYLRLHLLSHRLVEPNTIALDGIFGVLPNVVWTSAGPCAVDGFERTRLRLRAAGTVVTVYGVDKFPRMLDYVLPTGVRVADADRVRLGAYLAPGTTVMHEGFVNFNAGTLGVCIVEGRISQGVVVGEGSDIGGGAGIMGTLSGGGKKRVRIGRRSLLGANAELGISLGDDCVVEAGLALMSGTKVTLLPAQGSGGEPRVVAAHKLSGASGLLYWRNSQTGAVEATPRAGHGVVLNAALHTNQ